MARAAGESVQWPEREEAFKVFVGPKLDRAYGPAAEATMTLDVAAGRGTLAEIVAFCRDVAGRA